MSTQPSTPSQRTVPGMVLLAASMIFVAPWALLALWAERGAQPRAVIAALGLTTLLVAAALFANGDVVIARSLVVIGAGCLAIVNEHRPSNRRASVLALLPTAQCMTTAAHLALMDAYPERFSPLWDICRSPSTLETVQWMLIVGLVAYEFGRVAIRVLGTPVDRFTEGTRRMFDDLGSLPLTLDVIAGAGVTIFLLIMSIRGFGYLTSRGLPPSLQGILGSLDYLYYLGLYAAVAAALRRKWRRGWVLAWVLVALTYEVLSGSKGRFALYVLFPLGTLVLFVVKRPGAALTATAVTTFLVSWLVVYPILAEYRSELVRTRDTASDRVELLSSAQGRVGQDYEDTILIPIFESQLTEQVTAMASIVHFDVRRPADHLPIRLMFFWVPRAVWPEKPETLNANEIGRASHRVSAADEGTSVVSTAIGELYVHLGPWGALMLGLTGIAVSLLIPVVRIDGEASDLELGVAVMLTRLLPGFVSGTYDMALTGFFIQATTLAMILIALRWMTQSALSSRSLAPGQGRVATAARAIRQGGP